MSTFQDNYLGLRDRTNLQWLITLRWAAVVGQLATLATAVGMIGINIRPTPILLLVGIGAISNALLRYTVITIDRVSAGSGRQFNLGRLAGAVMLFDVSLLSAMLFWSGGPSNPFSVFYIVNISLSAAVLNLRWAWTLTFVAVGCFGLLFLGYVPVKELEHHAAHAHAEVDSGAASQLHFQGMLVAFAGASAFVTYFVTRVTSELRLRDLELADAERRRLREEKMHALITLAAGAAHELATPLSTISVVIRELELGLERDCTPSLYRQDVQVVRGEIERCQGILSSLTGRAGEPRSETWQKLNLAEGLSKALAAFDNPAQVELTISPAAEAAFINSPRDALAQAFRSIIKNALDASESSTSPVIIHAEVNDGIARIEIVDAGSGIPQADLSRVGEPFFTTRPPGKGMGLGVFLAKRVFEQLEGTLTLEPRIPKGTVALITLPCESFAVNK